jgi:cytosine deaminase
MSNENEKFVNAMIDEAKSGLAEGGIPIGSVLVQDEEIISKGHNQRVQNNDPLAHAEIMCLRNAGRIGSFRDTIIYSTLMPCYLCAGAIVQFGIKKVVVGESKNFEGAKEFMKSYGVEVLDINSSECIELMSKFIQENPKLWNEDIGGINNSQTL